MAKNTHSNELVIIENQLEITDHDHLSKIIVYAAGHDAKTIIWIVKDVRDEHRQAVDWLNEHTDNEVNIFLIRLELWQINDSELAPKFNVISSPNTWTKTIKTSNGTITDLQLTQLDYWNKFTEYADKNTSVFKVNTNPKPQNFYILNSEKRCYIEVTIDSNRKYAYIVIYEKFNV